MTQLAQHLQQSAAYRAAQQLAALSALCALQLVDRQQEQLDEQPKISCCV
jgi:hypothetical protein